MAKVKSLSENTKVPGLVFSRRTIKKLGGDVYDKNVRSAGKKFIKVKGEKRPNIPTLTQLRLWVLAGGRCEFPGCNQPLLKDNLTLNEGNYANIAHIVAWTPGGPRGDEKLSPLLAKDISNLMLMCLKHGKLIDLKQNLSFYTVDFLRKCKSEHERRVAIQTSIHPSRKSTVLRVQSNIRNRSVELPYDDACNALVMAGRYPIDDKGILIDLTNIDYSLEKAFWDTAAGQIDSALQKGLTVGNDGQKVSHLSVFGVAPIPLLMYLGFKLGNLIKADIYLKLREKPWSVNSSPSKLKFIVERNNIESKSEQIGLAIGISGGGPTKEDLEKHMGSDFPVYTVKISDPNLDSIQSVEDLENFRSVYRKLITEIKGRHGKKCQIHLFGAIPTSIAIICGREILHDVDPKILVYEHVYEQNGYAPAIIIN